MEIRDGLELRSHSRISNMLISVSLDSWNNIFKKIPFIFVFLTCSKDSTGKKEVPALEQNETLSSTKISGKKYIDLDGVSTNLEQLEVSSL